MDTGHAHGTHASKQIKYLYTENKSESFSGRKKEREGGRMGGKKGDRLLNKIQNTELYKELTGML